MIELSEKDIENQILTYLEARGIFAWKAEKATGRSGRKHGSRFHLNGISDILAVMPGGIILAIEVKTKKGAASESQETFLEKIASYGGRSILARSVEDVHAALSDL